MTALGYLVACMLIGHAAAGVVELNCSANATCIEKMMKDFARSIRQQKTVRLFDTLTIEPQRTTGQMRSSQGWLSNFLDTHAISYDWEDYTIKLASSDRADAMNLEVYESRTAKDVSEPLPKKSKSKVEQPDEDDNKTPKRQVIKRSDVNPKASRQLIDISIVTSGLKQKLVAHDFDKLETDSKKKMTKSPSKLVPTGQRGRRQKRKVLQAVIPLLFGMKSSGAVIFALSVVTVLVMKAFIASKLALLVTAGMALRRLYESYSNGVGLQNHPYLYSQYPIDFPSASSHAYSVSGVNPQFATPEMYNPTGLASQMLQSNEQSAQQSQQSPTVQLVNATHAAERWDGKSLIQRFLEPIVDGVKSIINPIANVVYDAMPTFRGLNTEVSTTKTHETEALIAEESVKQPREILVPQPRNIAQRKMNYRSIMRNKPKKYNELNVDLNKLKNNKDFHDYIKTKKYKHNYPNTYYYPRIKYFVNPHAVVTKPNNSRLASYRKITPKASNVPPTSLNKTKQTITPIDSKVSSEWKPILVLNTTTLAPKVENITINKNSFLNFPKKQYIKSFKQKLTKRKRIKRDLSFSNEKKLQFSNSSLNPRKIDDSLFFQTGRGFFDFIDSYFNSKTVDTIAPSFLKQVTTYTKSVVKENMHEQPPVYYTAAYELLMMSLDMIDGLVNVQFAIEEHLSDGKKGLKRRKKKRRKTAVSKTKTDEATTTPIATTVKKAKKNLKH